MKAYYFVYQLLILLNLYCTLFRTSVLKGEGVVIETIQCKEIAQVTAFEVINLKPTYDV